MVWNDVHHGDLLKNTNTLATGLSFAGSIFMIYHCLRVPSRNSVTVKLILSIALADFIYSIANLMSAYEDKGPQVSAFCKAEAVLRAFSHVMSIFFASSLSVICYKSVSRGRAFDQEQFFKISSLIGALYCLLQIILPAFVKEVSFVNGDILCNVTYTSGVSRNTKLIVRLGYEAFPIVSSLLITLGSYLLTIRKIRELPEEVLSSMDLQTHKLFWYPAVLLITFVPSALDNFGAIYFGSDVRVEIKLLHLFFTHSIGFTNAIVYGIQRRLHKGQDYRQKSVQLLSSYYHRESDTLSVRNELEKAGDISI